MDKYKDWYSNRKGKYILFFGFYLIFFIFLAIYIRSLNKNNQEKPKKEENTEVEKITTYNITNLINNDYKYEIVIYDNEEIIKYNGSKNNIDYANYVNKYFLDIYNINQLLKRSKFISSNNNVLTYELASKEINDILLTENKDGINKIDVYVNTHSNKEKIVLDLTNYFEKKLYQINIKYIVGDANENSPS